MRVFVYGSLMRGLGNHGALEGAAFLGRARVEAGRFRMLDLGGCPGLVPDEGGPAIEGEVYEAGDEVMARLDRLEGHPRLYRREPVVLEGEARGAPIGYVLADPGEYRGRPAVASGDWRAYLAGRVADRRR